MSQVPTAATTPAMTGETRAGRITLPTTPSSLVPSPFQLTPLDPRPAIVAPISPPNRACEERRGRPRSQVSRFQSDPADQAGQDDQQQGVAVVGGQVGYRCAGLVLDLHHGVGHGQRHLDREEGADEVEHRGQRDGDLGPQGAGGDGGGHRVAGVVEAVGEVEGQRGHDDQDQDEGRVGHSAAVRGRAVETTPADEFAQSSPADDGSVADGVDARAARSAGRARRRRRRPCRRSRSGTGSAASR